MNQSKPIKSKEEIYKEAWAKWANETFITDPPLKTQDCDNEHSWIYGAMDEYAKQFRTPIAEGEERLLREALENLLEAIPKQTNDADWWPDELTKAVEEAKKVL